MKPWTLREHIKALEESDPVVREAAMEFDARMLALAIDAELEAARRKHKEKDA